MLPLMPILCLYLNTAKFLITFKYTNTNTVCLCLNITDVYFNCFFVLSTISHNFTTREKIRLFTNCLYVIQHQDKILQYIMDL